MSITMKSRLGVIVFSIFIILGILIDFSNAQPTTPTTTGYPIWDRAGPILSGILVFFVGLAVLWVLSRKRRSPSQDTAEPLIT